MAAPGPPSCPSRATKAAICARERMPSLTKIEARCFSTVLELIDSRSAISVFVNPSVTSSAMVSSRCDSGPLPLPAVRLGAGGARRRTSAMAPQPS